MLRRVCTSRSKDCADRLLRWTGHRSQLGFTSVSVVRSLVVVVLTEKESPRRWGSPGAGSPQQSFGRNAEEESSLRAFTLCGNGICEIAGIGFREPHALARP